MLYSCFTKAESKHKNNGGGQFADGRQGDVLSPLIFDLFVNVLLRYLNESGVGAHVTETGKVNQKILPLVTRSVYYGNHDWLQLVTTNSLELSTKIAHYRTLKSKKIHPITRE